jgi:hypothetical protein
MWGAVCSEPNNSLRMTIINPDKLEALQLPSSLSGLSRATEGNIFSDSVFCDSLQYCAEEMDVPSLSLSAILEASQGRHPAIISVDTDGMDFAIITTILYMNLRPLIIVTNSEFNDDSGQLKASVEAAGYKVMDDGGSTLLIHTDFMMSYCSYLYVNFGISTIFSEIIHRVFRKKMPS